MPRVQFRAPSWSLAGLLVAAMAVTLLSAACFQTESGEESGGSTDGIDRSALLGELDEVRDLFAQTSPLDAELLADVDYREGQLTVTLSDDAQMPEAQDAAEQAAEVCEDLGQAIQLPDLVINVDAPDGVRLASCSFDGVPGGIR